MVAGGLILMNLRNYLIETAKQNELLSGNTSIREKFRNSFSYIEDVFHFRHTMEYQAQLPTTIVKALNLPLVDSNTIDWNKSKTQKTVEKFYSDGKVGVYMLNGTGLSWMKHMTGLLGTKSEESFEQVKLILIAKGILKL